MNSVEEVTYALDFRAREPGHGENKLCRNRPPRRVTRARMTQIIKLLDLAPDIQEQILFLPTLKGLNERNLRPIVSRIDWNEQRRMFQKIVPIRPRGREK